MPDRTPIAPPWSPNLEPGRQALLADYRDQLLDKAVEYFPVDRFVLDESRRRGDTLVATAARIPEPPSPHVPNPGPWLRTSAELALAQLRSHFPGYTFAEGEL